MALAPGTRLGPYDVLGQLGAGGMGEVYRATDIVLKRQVALKVLPPEVASDPERVARFQREAEVLASLNHPNIAHLYGLERSGGTLALVMELVEGPTLADRIAKGAIPLDEALPVAKQIAEALEAAHDQRIIHRDLKPANIKVRDDGTVKVLDFGLAKAMEQTSGRHSSSTDPANSPTITSPAMMTGVGLLIGTAAYMAPEQARGRAADKRADIWAFGVVVCEMVTGRRLFNGEELSDVLAAVLRQDIDWSSLPPQTPGRLRRLLERCLDRDPKTRLRDIGEARVEIGMIEAGAPDVSAVATPLNAQTRRTRYQAVAWSVAAVALVLAVVGFVRHPPSDAGPGLVRLPFLPPDDVAIESLSSTRISPDGKKVLFSGRSSDGRQRLWVRSLDEADAKRLGDTEDAIEAFWSPDSRSVAFGAQGKLKRIDLAGGGSETLTDAPRLVGGAWSPAGVIVFGPDYNVPLVRIAANGSGRTPATKGEAGDDRYPEFLPDGRHFLFSSGRGEAKLAVMLGSIDSMDVRSLLPDYAPAVYAGPGWLLYSRNGTIVAHAFDPTRLELSGDPHPIVAAPQLPWAPGGRFSVSENGIMVVQDPQGYDYQLRWFDRSGTPLETLGPVTRVSGVQVPRISPDGRRAVVQRQDLTTRNQDLWIGDLARGTFDRFTTDPAQEQLAIWSADGSAVICTTNRHGVTGIYRFPLAGGDSQLLVKGTVFPEDVSPDGKWLFFGERSETSRFDLFAQRLSGTPGDGRSTSAQTVAASPFDEQSLGVSPDGRWVAYVSDVATAPEVYVRRWTTDGSVGEATRVSSGGGVQPRWSRDGHELFYISAPRGYSSAVMMAVPVTFHDTAVDFGTPARLFTVRMLPNQQVTRDYDVSADGRRFLIGTVVGDAPVTPITVMLNWHDLLKQRLPIH